jgi:hypothetical protein
MRALFDRLGLDFPITSFGFLPAQCVEADPFSEEEEGAWMGLGFIGTAHG